MPGIPDDVTFAQLPDRGGELLFGAVRKNPGPVFRVQCLAHRLNSFLLPAYRELRDKNVNSPFSVAINVMTGIGTLGEIFYSTPVPRDPDTSNRENFCRFCAKVHQRFGRPPPDAFKTAFSARWGVDRPDSVATIFYTYFRNTLIHGYYGRAVFLTGQDTQDLLLRADGCVLVHPTWLLERFISAAEDHVADLVSAPVESRLSVDALAYLNRLLG